MKNKVTKVNLNQTTLRQEMVKNLAKGLKGPLQKDFEKKGENINLNSNFLKGNKSDGICIIKSPSDTTIYSPALRQKRIESIGKSSFDQLNSKAISSNISKPNVLINEINEFVERIRRESTKGGSIDDAVPSTSSGRTGGGADNFFLPQCREQSREQELAEQAIINAEKFKADINSSGMNTENSVPPVDLNFDDNKDEEFSEGTCHVDQQNMSKICKGQFIEVAKLIPKQQSIKNNENKRIEFVNRDGMTYYIPSANEKEQKVTNVRKWESGFKVYAAIYSKANPHRGAEIWQYIHTINLAASSYHWDNVAYYDFMFRQQMAKYPQRSWRKINHQLWSLAMRDPIPKFGSNQNSSNFGTQGNSHKNNRENCCWRYNRNKCNRSSRECRFEHKCSICGSANHILLNCLKNRRNNGNNQSNSGENNSQNASNSGDKKNHTVNKHGNNSGNSS